jgi:hypothetical protein
MSRTEEDIACGVDITIMRDTTLRACPASYSEVRDTFRPRLACARRTDSGRERFIDFLVPSPERRRFVAKHVSEEFIAALGGQPIEVKAARPALVPFERLQLRVVAEIPHKVACARMAFEQPGQRFDVVPIDQQHRQTLMRLRGEDKTLKLPETSTFTPPLLKNARSCARRRKTRVMNRHFVPGASAGASVPDSR